MRTTAWRPQLVSGKNHNIVRSKAAHRRRFHWLIAAALLSFADLEISAHEQHNTHATLTVGALLFLDLVAPEDAWLFNEEARGNVRLGSILEDECPNYISHFYNPKTGQNTMPDISLPVCLKPTGWVKQTAPQRAADFWALAVAAYATNKSAAFLHLGHVMHLLQDMTSPAHVHNDIHADAGGNCDSDGDDFERWGWCVQPASGNQPAFNFTNIYRYIRYASVTDSALLPQMTLGLTRVFANRPQFPSSVAGQNSGYAFVSRLANSVYDFTTFGVTLTDTLNPNDPGGGELKRMFPSLEETTVPAAWWIDQLGYSQGQCTGLASTFQQAWWMMSCTVENYCGPFLAPKSVYCVEGMAYLENVGGGTGTQQEVPNTLIPAEYDRAWFRSRYNGTKNNTGQHRMLDIYGDVLYPAAVAYGAGLIQRFLDEAIMPKPVTTEATQLTAVSAQLNGQVRPAGEAATTWFEWGVSPTFGNVTTGQDVGAGNVTTNVSARIEGLAADTLYYGRIVLSNRLGVRYGTNQTFRTPAVLVTGSVPNAWQINDASTTSTVGYVTNLNASHQTAANSSWRYTLTCRMVDDFGGSKAMNFHYQISATRRFLVWWDLDANGNLTAELEGQPVRVVATNGLGATLYHTHELSYTNGTGTYRMDGTVIGTWSGANIAGTAGRVAWGGGSSAGRAQMNFREVDFQVHGAGTVASYHAGHAPAAAPNPTTRGWMVSPAAPTPPVVVSAISPDFEAFVARAETLVATEVRLTTARLNGRVDPQGQDTVSWFEWGTTSSYGNRTGVQTEGNHMGWSETHEDVAGLTAEQTYHFRLVASNSFTVAFGQDQIFRTGGFTSTNMPFAAVDVGAVAWGDYDNDGDLDVLITGQSPTGRVSHVYRQLNDGTFANINAGLPGVNWSSVTWGDCNNDGWLDFALSGSADSGLQTRVYIGNGTSFTDMQAGLPGLWASALTWFDYNNDGFLDLLITGEDAATNRISRIYHNAGGTNYVDINAGLIGVSHGAVLAADFDSDGDNDIILVGAVTAGVPEGLYYRNDGGGTFTTLELNIPAAYTASLSAGDYDNDGDLDILLTGDTGQGLLTQVLRNIRNGNVVEFEPIATTMPDVAGGSGVWGDYDNDGDLDIGLSGWRGSPFADVFRNDGNNTFLPLNAGMTGVFWSSAGWADVDRDGDLDLLVTGRDDMGGPETRAIRLYRNESLVSNTPPSTPTMLAGSGVGDRATVSWEAATDLETAASGLTYNVVLGTNVNGWGFASPMANITNGVRRVVQAGNAHQNLAWTFMGLRPGTYHFSVQAIDSAFNGGPFSPWQSFEVSSLPVTIVGTTVPAPGQFQLQVIGTENSVCEVLRSTDLTTWIPVGLCTELSPGLFEFLDSTAPPEGGFYRVRSSLSVP